MTKTITINIPKPGDTLPFIVAEWKRQGKCYKAGYSSSGSAFVEASDNFGSCSAGWYAKVAIFALLDLPLSVKTHTPATEVTE